MDCWRPVPDRRPHISTACPAGVDIPHVMGNFLPPGRRVFTSEEQMLPILQDRIFMGLLLLFVFVGGPLLFSDYLLLSILIPFLNLLASPA